MPAAPCPQTAVKLSRRAIECGHRGHGWRGGGIKAKDGGGLLQTVEQGFEQLLHGCQGRRREQRAQPLPHQALTAQLRPHCLEQGATPLLGLVDQERQHHQHGKHDRQMLLAMSVVVLKVIALVFQRLAGLVFDFPPGASPSPKRIHVALTHADVGDPTAVLDLVLAHLPGLDKMDPHLRVRRIEGYVMEKAKPMSQAGGAVVALIIGDPSGVLRGLALLKQRGMIPCFDTQDVVQTMRVQGLDVWGIRTQTVFGDDALEVRMILAQLGHKALGSMTFAIILGRPITVDNRLGHERHDGPLVRMDARGAQHLVRIGDGPVAVHPVST